MKKFLPTLILAVGLLWGQSAFANACAWVSGSTKNWSDTTAWTSCGGVAPTANDTVTVSGTGTLTIDGTSGSPNLAGSVDFTGFTGTLTHNNAKFLNIGNSSLGSLTLVSGMTYAPSNTATIKFVSTTTGNNIAFGGKNIPALTFDGVGGGWTFTSAPGSGQTPVITLTNGSLDTGSFNVTATLSSSNSNTRSLTLGTTTWTIANGVSGTVWDIGTATGMTLSAASSTIVDAITAGANTFAGGGLTYGTLTNTAETTAAMTITGANTFATLTTSIAGTAKNTTSGYVFPSGVTTTVTGTFTAAGNTLLLRNFLYSSTLGTAATISAGTFTITNTDLRDITKAGAGSGNISATSSSTGNGDCGGNTGWTFQTARNVYMKTAVSVNWSAGNWYTTSGGSTAATPPIPLCHDTNAIFDANSVTATGKTITVDEPRISGYTFTGVLNTPSLLVSGSLVEVYGSAVLVSGMTITSIGPQTFMGRGAYTWDGGTLTYPTASNITLSAPTGTYTLARNFTSNSQLVVTTGTWASGGFNQTWTGIAPQGGTISGSGTITGTSYTQTGGTVTLGGVMTINSSGALAVSAGTLDMNGYQITGLGSTTISGTGTLNLSGQINGSGAFSITGGTITDAGASGELKGTTMSFSGGTSAIRKMTASSTFAISSTAALTFNPGVSTWVTSFTETGTTHSLTYNGTAVNNNGTLTVTAAASGAASCGFMQ